MAAIFSPTYCLRKTVSQSMWKRLIPKSPKFPNSLDLFAEILLTAVVITGRMSDAIAAAVKSAAA